MPPYSILARIPSSFTTIERLKHHEISRGDEIRAVGGSKGEKKETADEIPSNSQYPYSNDRVSCLLLI